MFILRTSLDFWQFIYYALLLCIHSSLKILYLSILAVMFQYILSRPLITFLKLECLKFFIVSKRTLFSYFTVSQASDIFNKIIFR